MVDLIGEGSFGKVYRVSDTEIGNNSMALKVEGAGEGNLLEREIKVMIEMR